MLKFRLLQLAILAAGVAAPNIANAQGQTQHLIFAGLRSVASQGQCTGIATGSSGEMYLLLDQGDGVRLLKTDAAAETVLGETLLGATGDHGLGIALDPAGSIFITGTTTSSGFAGTGASAFPSRADASTNSFIAAFNADLSPRFVTFTGSGRTAATGLAVTADAVFVTGSIFSPGVLPVTSGAILQAPAAGSSQNGFVERFTADGSTLVYATYVTGLNGSTAPAAIVADTADHAYVAGYTSSSSYPAVAALVPAMLSVDTNSPSSGFLTKLSPAGDGIGFSTYIPGAGVTSLAIDVAAQQLLLTGTIALGEFPITTVVSPLVATVYQTLVRLPLDGSFVLSSTLLAPGTQSYVAAGAGGTAWVAGALSGPLLPIRPFGRTGNSFAIRVTGTSSATTIDQIARFGGLPDESPSFASAPVSLAGLTIDSSGEPTFAGQFTPTASASLLGTETYDLALSSPPTQVLSSSVSDSGADQAGCTSGSCSGSAAYLARISPTAGAALVLSSGDAPNILIRNLGSTAVSALEIASSGQTLQTSCGPDLQPGAECNVALTGTFGGTLTVSAGNAATQTLGLPASARVAEAIVFSPKELDFGTASAAGAAETRTITITNVSEQTQTFVSMLDIGPRTKLPYTLAESASDCTANGAATSKQLAAGATCHITLSFAASTSAANDGFVQQNWKIGDRDVLLTAFSEAAALNLSAALVEFGTQYAGTPHLSRYLYISNNSTEAVSHTGVTLSPGSPFTVTDRCAASIAAQTVCQLQLDYSSAAASSDDAVTLSLDQGLTVTVTGNTLPRPGASAATVNPDLSVTPAAIGFRTPVPVTAVSMTTQTVTITNAGAQPFALSLAVTGDFTETTSCESALAAGASCMVQISFTPSQPGTRAGLLAVTAGAGTSARYVALSGTGTGIVDGATNSVAFGAVLEGEPSVVWYKVSHPFAQFRAAISGSAEFAATLVEDGGYGHGQPLGSAFSAVAAGTCFNCWLGLRFKPTLTGSRAGAVTFTSAADGAPYTLGLTGTGLPVTGFILSPPQQDFGTVAAGSSSAPAVFILTNATLPSAAVGTGLFTLTGASVSGSFRITDAVSGAAPCAGGLPAGTSCQVAVSYTPSASGTSTGSLNIATNAGPVTANLTGYATPNPGVALNPSSLVFANVPGATSTEQTVTFTNMGTSSLAFGVPTVSTRAFSVSENCGTLAAGASCTITVLYRPSNAPAADTLQIAYQGGSTDGTSVLPVPLTGTYTLANAGLEIVPAINDFGPSASGTPGQTRQLTINNLTAKAAALKLTLPREFALASPPCAMLQANASCSFSITSVPQTNGFINGTLLAQGTPLDGSSVLNGISYLESYGQATNVLMITGAAYANGLLSFGQVTSGQIAEQTLTLTNNGGALLPASTALTVRRITVQPPFYSASDCGAALALNSSCTVSIRYAPLNQVSIGSPLPPATNDSGVLAIESDSTTGADVITVAGIGAPVAVASPSNLPAIAALTGAQGTLSFAATSPGNISPLQTVALTNSGGSTIHISSLQTTSDFTETSTCATLLPGAACAVDLRFTPQPISTEGNTRVGALKIRSDAATSLDFISLVGATDPAVLSLTPASLTFGSAVVGTTATLQIAVTNSGSTAAIFNGYQMTGDYSVGGTCPAVGSSLAGMASCTLVITFSPTAAGLRPGSLTLANSATALPLTLTFSGVGVLRQLIVTPARLVFPATAVGSSTAETLTLANTGSAPVTNLVLSATGDFSVTDPCALSTLAPGQSCSINISFKPSITGARAGMLSVSSSDPLSPTLVPLTGTGVGAPSFQLAVNGASTTSITVAGGSPANYSLSLTPLNGFTGNISLTCSAVTPVRYGACSLMPSTVVLGTSPRNAAATIATIASIVRLDRGPLFFSLRSAGVVFALLFLPGILGRRDRSTIYRRCGFVLLFTTAAISLMGCGGSQSISNIGYTPAGTYQYTVTATSSGTTQVVQTVTLNLVIQ